MGDVPPPVHGMAAINKALLECIRVRCRVYFINTVPSALAKYFNSRFWLLIKGVFFFPVTAQLLWALFTRKDKVFYRALNGGAGQVFDVCWLWLARLSGAQIFLHHHASSYLQSPTKLFKLATTAAGQNSEKIIFKDKKRMSRIIKAGLIQAHNVAPTDSPIEQIRKANIDHQMTLVEDAAKQGVQMLCFQEVFTMPYFCAEQTTRWYEAVERIPDGPTVKLMQEVAKQHGMVIVVPIYEEEQTGVYYNTAAVIDADGTYLGKYRKTHIPHVAPGFWEKFYFKPGNLGYPCFDTAYARIGVYICYDRHFPEGARCLGLNGAEIIFNPSATVAGLSEYLWKLEQPAPAVANGYFVGAINRVGTEAPWNIG